MEIDWSTAPEWAKGHGLVVQGSIKQVWYGDFSYMVVGDSRAYPFGGGSGETRHNHTQDAIQFKTLRPAPWTGEGLPPVGTVCEFLKHNSPPAPEGQWAVGDIRYVSDCTVIIGGDKCEHVHHPRNCSFRPLRTPEQIAVEQKNKAINAAMQGLEPFATMAPLAVVEYLYDAGFIKQPTDQ